MHIFLWTMAWVVLPLLSIGGAGYCAYLSWPNVKAYYEVEKAKAEEEERQKKAVLLLEDITHLNDDHKAA